MINFIKSIIKTTAHPIIIKIKITEVIRLALPFKTILGIREKSKGKSLKRYAVAESMVPAMIIDTIFTRKNFSKNASIRFPTIATKMLTVKMGSQVLNSNVSMGTTCS
jgi:hypothetical protein